MNTIEMLKELVENGGMFVNEDKSNNYIVSFDPAFGVCVVTPDKAFLKTVCMYRGFMNHTWKPYVKPVDWSQVPIDTRVLCSTRLGWVTMHYAGLSDKGKPTVWDAGRTSHTTKDRVSGWDEMKLAEDAPCSR